MYRGRLSATGVVQLAQPWQRLSNRVGNAVVFQCQSGPGLALHVGVTWDDLGFSVLLLRQEWRHLVVCQFLQLFSCCRSAV